MRLDKTCRACLSEDVEMTTMSHNNILQKFLFITNLTNSNEIADVCSNICHQCEEKLNVSFQFREKCQKSHDFLSNYVISIKLKQEEADKKALRLERFSYTTVTQAIEDSKKDFYENTQCIRCDYLGGNARALSIHVSVAHKELKGRWCYKCNEEFEDLNVHSESSHGDDLMCKFCSKKFRTRGHLNEHLHSHSDVRPFPCSYCDMRFVSNSHLTVHLRKHTKEKPYKCHLCDKRYSQLNRLKDHLKTHDATEAVLPDDNLKEEVQPLFNFCVKCDKKVRSLVIHTKEVHSGRDKEQLAKDSNKLCTACGKQFKTATKLRVHMRIHTGDAPYKCAYCDKKVTTRNQLVVHERTHTGEKPHICHVCGKSFAQSSVLNTHMRLHTGPTITCKICDQRFCRPAQLRLHLRRHTGEKPYLCSECGQAFTQRCHLVEHNKTHSDFRPFQCNFCDKAFKQSSSLKHHVQIHLGEKPYKCNQCSYACRQSYSLTQHMKQHVIDKPRPEKPHACTMCNKSFSTDAMLTSHFTNVHNIVYLDM